jgi:DNA-binding response OmpR family regulator
MKQPILVIADEVSLRASLARWLMAAGYTVELAESAKRARDAAARGNIALAILVPERVDGAEVLARQLADAGRLILVTGSADRFAGKLISAAAVTFVSTPPREQDVLASVEAAFSFAAGPKTAPEPAGAPEWLRFEGYALDIAGRACLNPAGAEVSLTRAEFSLLLALARHPGRVLSRDELRQAMAGRDADPDDRSVDVLISRLRRKIERDPKAPRMIITVPGTGYKFGVKTQAAAAADEIALAPPAAPVTELMSGKPEDSAQRPGPAEQDSKSEAERGGSTEALPVLSDSRAAAFWTQRTIGVAGILHPPLIGAAAAVLVGVASLLFVLWHAGVSTKNAPAAAPGPRFDAAVIPLVSDTVRKDLANYAERPDFKALAISAASRGWGLSFGAPDEESAKREALQRCSVRSAPMVCRIYAVGMDVVWSPAALAVPIPADIHTESLDIPLDVEAIPTMSDTTRRRIVEKYVNHSGHKALAIKRDGFYFNTASTPMIAPRLAVERCADVHQVPCLLLSVDGMLTVQIPRSHRVRDIFLLTTEPEMSEQEKERIGQVYREKEWRALARGGSGRWYPVANAASESDAVDAALDACARQDRECRIYAIGNFRVADDK